MSVVQKIIAAFLGLALIPILLISGLLYLSFSDTLNKQAIKELEYIGTIQQHRTEDSINRNFARIDSLRNLSILKNTLANQNIKPSVGNEQLLNQTIQEIKTADGNIRNVSIISPTGTVVASTNTLSQGQQLADKDYFASGKDHIDVTSYLEAIEENEVRLYLVGPIIFSDKLAGVALIEIDTADLFPHLLDFAGLGETGETLLVRKAANPEMIQVLAPTRHGSALSVGKQLGQNNEALSNRAAVNTDATFTHIYDYRDKPVLAVSRQVGTTDWRIITKIDQAEINKPITELRDTLLLLIFVITVVCVFLALFVARAFTEPLLALSKAASQMSKGDLKQRVNVNRDDEIGVLATAFNSMAESVEHIDRAKSEFILLASHQLRTPLTAVKWFSKELLAPIKPLGKSKQNHYIKQIHDSNDRMIYLVNELLIASKVDLGTLPAKLAEVSLAESLDTVVEDISGIIKDGKIHLHTDVDDKIPTIMMDPTWVHMILQNLLSNAVKYSHSGQEISVSIQKAHNEIVITVSDHGYGIPSEQQDKIFTKLFRADNARKLINDGSGLGLYISKALVELSGGTIWFESILGQGTTFYVKLPLTPKH